jgi:hypothetical protein
MGPDGVSGYQGGGRGRAVEETRRSDVRIHLRAPGVDCVGLWMDLPRGRRLHVASAAHAQPPGPGLKRLLRCGLAHRTATAYLRKFGDPGTTAGCTPFHLGQRIRLSGNSEVDCIPTRRPLIARCAACWVCHHVPHNRAFARNSQP